MAVRLSSWQHEGPANAGLFVGRGGGRRGVCATRGQADIRGLGTAGPGFVWRARRLGTGVTGRDWPAAHSCVTDALARRPLAAATATNGCCRRGSVGGGDRPAEPCELARGGDGDDRASLVALLHPVPDVMQPPLRLPGERDDLGLTVALAAREAARDPRRAAGGDSARPLRPAAGARAGCRTS